MTDQPINVIAQLLQGRDGRVAIRALPTIGKKDLARMLLELAASVVGHIDEAQPVAASPPELKVVAAPVEIAG